MRIVFVLSAATGSVLLSTLALPIGVPAWVRAARPQTSVAAHRAAARSASPAPVRFEPGEDRAGVPTAVARVAGAVVVLSSAGADAIVQAGAPDPIRVPSDSNATTDPDPSAASQWSLSIEGGLDGLTPRFEEPLPGVSNYLRGDDRSRWRRSVAGFARVRFRDVAPGIDVVYSGSNGRLTVDLVVAPDADPDGVRLVPTRHSFAGVPSARSDVPARMPMRASPGAPRLPVMAPDVTQKPATVRRSSRSGRMTVTSPEFFDSSSTPRSPSGRSPSLRAARRPRR